MLYTSTQLSHLSVASLRVSYARYRFDVRWHQLPGAGYVARRDTALGTMYEAPRRYPLAVMRRESFRGDDCDGRMSYETLRRCR